MTLKRNVVSVLIGAGTFLATSAGAQSGEKYKDSTDACTCADFQGAGDSGDVCKCRGSCRGMPRPRLAARNWRLPAL